MKRIIFSFVVVAAIVISAVVVTSCGSAKSERWEYKIVYPNKDMSSGMDGNRFQVEAEFNQLGAEGWELVSHGLGSGYSSSSFFTFKRRLP